ncbi:MAG: MerR family transcriptional regulator [Clostridiales bacterium]|nr:MerR family transcriptional regulator [Clostridiales bacterium]
MKINEAEALVGITRKNIRFYEQEGLLTPRRNRANGYRDYGDEDVARLQQIKLLRKLGMPLSDIRRVLSGEQTLTVALNRHGAALRRERTRLEQSLALTVSIAGENLTLDTLDAAGRLREMEQLEQGGTVFMNRQTGDRRARYWGAILSAAAMALLMAGMIALLVWGAVVDPIPLALLLVFEAIPAAVLIGIVLALRQRLQELKGDELDDARQY